MNTKQNLLKVLLGGASFLILGAFLYLVWPNIEILFPGETTKTLSFNDHIFLVIANGLLTFYFVIDALLEVKPMPRKILWLVLLTMFNLIVNPIYWYIQLWRKRNPDNAAHA